MRGTSCLKHHHPIKWEDISVIYWARRPKELQLKEALHIQTAAEELLKQDAGLEVSGCWLTTLRKNAADRGQARARQFVMFLSLCDFWGTPIIWPTSTFTSFFTTCPEEGQSSWPKRWQSLLSLKLVPRESLPSMQKPTEKLPLQVYCDLVVGVMPSSGDYFVTSGLKETIL